ncbi:MAG: response regulator [Solirubrobacteraceae bacterium]
MSGTSALSPSVVVADDDPRDRFRLRALLADGGLEVNGEAADGGSAIGTVLRLRPEVILLDVSLDGAAATREIVRREPGTAVVALAESARDEDLAEVMLAGAAGHVLRSASTDRLLDAVRAAAGGETRLGPEVAGRLLELWRQNEYRRVATPERRTDADLSEREIDVLCLLADGSDHAAIADELGLGHNAIKRHVASILDKLGAANRAAAPA